MVASLIPSLTPKAITFFLDFISPYAFMAFDVLPRTLEGIAVDVRYKPVLFAGMLKHYGQLGPAEIAPKRDWTFRQVLWLAREHGVELELPRAHPFNPLALLRLSLACAADSPATGAVSREVCSRIFRHIWVGGETADDSIRMAALTGALAPALNVDAPEVKAALRTNTDQAIGEGVFGVPTLIVDGHAFWGFDALPMLRAYLKGDAFFDGPWEAAARIGAGVRR